MPHRSSPAHPGPRRSLQYQSFPDASGDSSSLDKLKALHLPVLDKKRFLDLGCNEGFFCGFALHDGAAEAIGIDSSAEFIERARQRFPAGRFLHQRWDSLPAGPFDVILLASALHYAADQPALVARAMGVLGAGGCLVLELGISPEDGTRWIEVNRGQDQRLFPTLGQLTEMLQPYAWKLIGPSVPQSGDPVPRFVVHVTHRKPIAWVMLQQPAPGSRKRAESLFDAAGIPIVSGVDCLRGIASGALEAPRALREVMAAPVAKERFVAAVRKVAAAGLMPTLVDIWLGQAAGRSFALLAYAPDEQRPEIVARLRAEGYMVSVLTRPKTAALPSGHEEAQDIVQRELAKPTAWLMMQPPASGKTSVARAVFWPAGVVVVSGDQCFQEIASGKRTASKRLRQAARAGTEGWRYDVATRQALDKGLLPELVRVWLDQAAGQSFALDSFIPAAYHGEVEKLLREAGYRIKELTISGTGTALEPYDMTGLVADTYFVELSKAVQKSEEAAPPLPQEPQPFVGLRFIEAVRVAGGRLLVAGWAANEQGVPPARLDLRIDGVSARMQHLLRVPRPDVQELHNTTGDVGFRISVALPQGLSLEGLAERVEVICSDSGSWPDEEAPRQLAFEGTIGFVDAIRVEDGEIVVLGWAVHHDGKAPRVLEVRIDGKSLGPLRLRRDPRLDVQRHMDLWSPDVGYRIGVSIPRGLVLEDLDHRLEVFGGPSGSELSGPLWSIPAGRLPRSLPF